jgi:enolase-phosphatase E1
LIDLTAIGVRFVLLDIEGTTTPITFVYDVLFPYARTHMRAFIHRDAETGTPLSSALTRLGDELAADRDYTGSRPGDAADDEARRDALAASAEWLMDIDRKSPALKELQGIVWEEGYDAGELQGVVYEDVPRALERLRDAGIGCGIYSSGSVLAQRLLFRTTRYGDLTTLLSAHFDTAVGPKREPSSYSRIARELGVRPEEVLFVSDVSAELDAAISAGMRVALAVRPGNPAQVAPGPADVLHDFDALTVAAAAPG